MADKQTYTFSNDITTVEVSSLGAKIVVIPQDRADIYVEYDNPKDSPEFCYCGFFQCECGRDIAG